jgi:hypothetical protein
LEFQGLDGFFVDWMDFSWTGVVFHGLEWFFVDWIDSSWIGVAFSKVRIGLGFFRIQGLDLLRGRFFTGWIR